MSAAENVKIKNFTSTAINTFMNIKHSFSIKIE